MKIAGKVFNRIMRFYLSMLDDVSYAKVKYKWKFGRELRLDAPRYFSEKIQWLKLYDDNREHSVYADKYAVREIVAEKIGPEYLNELYFMTENPDTIDFASLPSSFVLKATHGSGYNLICADKNTFDIDRAKQKMRKWLSSDYSKGSRERQYGPIPRRIICEKFLTDSSGSLCDYKILCFDGVPKLIWVDVDRYTDHKRAFFTTEWESLPAVFNKYPRYTEPVVRPKNLAEMLSVAENLSRGFRFSRVDVYSVNGRVIFGEITFHPASGFADFTSDEFSFETGEWIRIDQEKN